MSGQKTEGKAACMQECIAAWLDCERKREDETDCRAREKSCFQECREA